MTEAQKIERLRILIDDETEPAETLSAYLEIAASAILNQMYPFKTDYTGLEVPDRYVSVQLKISSYLLLKRGAEGQIQHIENGIHRNYGSADIPKDMLKDVVPYCQVF